MDNLMLRRRAILQQAKSEELYPIGTGIISMYIGVQEDGNRRKFNPGYGINTSNGEYYASSGNYASDVYIPINPNYTYQKNNWRLNTWCFYDENKQYISAAPVYHNLNVQTLAKFPDNARYIRIQAYNFAGQAIEITRIS